MYFISWCKFDKSGQQVFIKEKRKNSSDGYFHSGYYSSDE